MDAHPDRVSVVGLAAGSNAEALAAHERSLAILQAAHASEIRIAASTYNLATVLYDMGKYAQAEEACHRLGPEPGGRAH